MKELLNNHPELSCVKTDIKTFLDKISLQESEADNKVDFNFSSPEVSESFYGKTFNKRLH
ncbi:MAG: hypothetical protein ACYCXQ_13595 [Candidatus Humimicrobiaceae bacterium]